MKVPSVKPPGLPLRLPASCQPRSGLPSALTTCRAARATLSVPMSPYTLRFNHVCVCVPIGRELRRPGVYAGRDVCVHRKLTIRIRSVQCLARVDSVNGGRTSECEGGGTSFVPRGLSKRMSEEVGGALGQGQQSAVTMLMAGECRHSARDEFSKPDGTGLQSMASVDCLA